jgi:hypothetical protein
VSGDSAVELIRAGWLTLAFMMLLSRAVFQAAGPVRMRAFLSGWQRGGVKRVWGAVALAYAAVVAVAAAATLGELSAFEVALLVALLLVLVADGVVNVLPAGFETFKDRLQRAWVARYRDSGKGGDRHLFGTVNALLALASAGVIAVVVAYRPIDAATIVVAASLALLLTAALLGASEVAAARHRRRIATIGRRAA